MKVHQCFSISVLLVFISPIITSAVILSCSIKNSNTTPSNITLTGTLISGTAIVNLSSYSSAALTSQSVLLPLSGSTMAGYKLRCITLESIPTNATSTADANGNFSLTFAAMNTPFGCFILDPLYKTVAALVFSASTGTTGQTINLSKSTDFGTITVDTSAGVALAGLPSTAGTIVTKTPSDVKCPVGTWVWNVNQPSPCAPGNITAILYIVNTGVGLVGTWDIGPVNLGNPITACGTYITTTNISTTTISFYNNIIRLDMPIECGTAIKTMEWTVDASCSTAKLTYNIDNGCGDCTKPDTWISTCNNCGSMTCSNAGSLGVTLTKQ